MAETDLINRILVQGEHLRNSIVKAILGQEEDHLHIPPENSLHKQSYCNDSNENLLAFLRGDELSSKKQEDAMETFRSTSHINLYKLITKAFNEEDKLTKLVEKEHCKNEETNISKQFHSLDLSLSHQQMCNAKEMAKYLKFVDCYKVTVHSLTLNKTRNKLRLPLDGTTFSVEYIIPNWGSKNKYLRLKSGNNNRRLIRCCGQRNCNEIIHFNHVTTHSCDYFEEKFRNSYIPFKITCKNTRDKSFHLLGCCRFQLGLLEYSLNGSLNIRLPVQLDETSSGIGVLEVTVQIGSKNSYFGKHFFDNINFYETSDDTNCDIDDITNDNHSRTFTMKETLSKTCPERIPKIKETRKLDIERPVLKSTILFGFIYVPQAQYFIGPLKSYISCQLFCEGQKVFSSIISSTTSPTFNFYQVVPLVLSEDLLSKFKENHMTIFFWRKLHLTNENDKLIGSCKVSLQQFYLAYRHSVIVQYLEKNMSPVISTDWWEPILSDVDYDIVGKAQILVALGTELQIQTLQKERGFENNKVLAQIYTPNKSPTQSRAIIEKPSEKINVSIECTEEDLIKNSQTKKIDVATQVVSQEVLTCDKAIQSFCNSESQDSNRRTIEMQLVTQDESNRIIVKNSSRLKSCENNSMIKETFKANLIVFGAINLPMQRNSRCKIDEPQPPSTYVTLETVAGIICSQMYMKSTRPEWNFQTDVELPAELLTESQNRFILKVWQTSYGDKSRTPNLENDIVLGIVTLDLSVLLFDFPEKEGWYNIIDLSRNCNGQVNVQITPLEDLDKFKRSIKTNKICSPKIDSFNQQKDWAKFKKIKKKKSTIVNLSPSHCDVKKLLSELDKITQKLKSKTINDFSFDSSSNIENTIFLEDSNNTTLIEDDQLIKPTNEATENSLNIENESHSEEELNAEPASEDINQLGKNQAKIIEKKQKLDKLMKRISELSSAFLKADSLVSNVKEFHNKLSVELSTLDEQIRILDSDSLSNISDFQELDE